MESDQEFEGKIIVVTAPSGAGKTTIVRHILKSHPEDIAFSVSATTREPRDYEKDSLHYYFLSREEFQEKVNNDEFIEYEEVYPGAYYGTLRSELERLWGENKHVIFDVDVYGAKTIKDLFPNRSLTIFIEPPSLETLQKRLEDRGTETPESIDKRMAKVREEMKHSSSFDRVIVNDNLEDAYKQADEIIDDFIYSTDSNKTVA